MSRICQYQQHFKLKIVLIAKNENARLFNGGEILFTQFQKIHKF